MYKEYIWRIEIPFYNTRSMHRIREHEADPNNTEEAYQEPTDRVDKVFTFWKDTYISNYHCW